MNIFVLLKQVPATESAVEVADDNTTIKTQDINWVINPYDEFAVEEALRIREASGGTVTILSVGPDKATEAIRTALAMGADKGILINDAAALQCDALGTAQILAAALKSEAYDLIIAGQRAVDGENFQVGTAVAEYLNIPNISLVIKQEIADGKITCHRTIEGGTVVMETQLPALITTQRGLNEPRYASLPGIMKAKKKPIENKTLADLDLGDELAPAKIEIMRLTPPPERQSGRLIEGDSAQAKAAELARVLHEESKVI